MEEANNKSQHREFVQSVINRLNTNSFQTKTIMITIVAAFLAIYASTSQIVFIIIPSPVILLFWVLDTYYLQQEKKFRGIYNDVCDLVPEKDNKTKKIFQMDPGLYKDSQYRFWNVFTSPSLILLYPTLIILLSITYFLVKNYK